MEKKMERFSSDDSLCSKLKKKKKKSQEQNWKEKNWMEKKDYTALYKN